MNQLEVKITKGEYGYKIWNYDRQEVNHIQYAPFMTNKTYKTLAGAMKIVKKNNYKLMEQEA